MSKVILRLKGNSKALTFSEFQDFVHQNKDKLLIELY